MELTKCEIAKMTKGLPNEELLNEYLLSTIPKEVTEKAALVSIIFKNNNINFIILKIKIYSFFRTVIVQCFLFSMCQ